MVKIKLSKKQKCIENIALVVMDASALEDMGLAVEAIHDAVSLKEILGNNKLQTTLNTMEASIARSSKRLQENLQNFEETCNLAPEIKGRYTEGKINLERGIRSADLKQIAIAGSFINDAIQDTVARGEAVSC